jgi:hypothetical protein
MLVPGEESDRIFLLKAGYILSIPSEMDAGIG